MKATYIDHMGTDLTVVQSARVSMGKQSDWDTERLYPDPETGFIGYEKLRERDAKLVRYLAKHRHYTPFEHCTVTLHLKVPIFVARQIHRHRTFAYNEISRRYVKDNLEFYWPDKWRKAADNVKQGSSDEEFPERFYDGYSVVRTQECLEQHVEYAVNLYNELTKNGMCAEQARMILPQNLYTEFYMTGSLRAWTHFLKLRLDSHAQKEVRDVAKQCAEIIAPLYPESFKALMENV